MDLLKIASHNQIRSDSYTVCVFQKDSIHMNLQYEARKKKKPKKKHSKTASEETDKENDRACFV